MSVPRHHHGEPVARSGLPLDAARAVTLLVHGRNRAPAEMIELAARLDVPGMAFVAPMATGLSWYPQSFLVPAEQNQPQLDDAIARLDALVAELEAAGFGKERMALVGFSQGACLLSEYVYRRPGRWGALASLTGGVVGPPGTTFEPRGSLAGTPMFFGNCAEDPWVPLARTHETAALFEQMGAQVKLVVRPGSEHIVSDDDLAATRAVIAPLVG